MAQISLTDIAGLLKTKYAGKVNSSVVKNVMLLNKISASNADVLSGSRTIIHAVRLTRNNGVGFRNSSSPNMPATKGSEVKQASSTVKSLYGYIEFDGPTLRATQNDEGAFAKVFQSELIELADSMKIEINRALYGWGTGKLGTCETVTGAATNSITIRNTFADQELSSNWFDEGQTIDIYNGASFVCSLVIDRIAVTSTLTTLYLTTDPAVAGAVSGYEIYLKDNYACEPMGLLGIADDGTYVGSLFGISNTDYQRWNGYVDDNTSGAALRAISETQVQNLLTHLGYSGSTPLLMTTDKIRNRFFAVIKATTVQPPTLDIGGGFKALSYNGNPIYADFFAPGGHMIGANLQFLKLHQLWPTNKSVFSAISFEGLDGQVLHETRGYDLVWAKAVADYEMTCTRRNAFGRISDIDPAL